jgi:hypothetical protein
LEEQEGGKEDAESEIDHTDIVPARAVYDFKRGHP